MKYLLDTHMVIWVLFNPEKLSKKVVTILKDEAVEKMVSTTSLWEISIKFALGKLELEDINPDQLLDSIKHAGFTMLSPAPELVTGYYKLAKKEKHRDPFDRMLIWEAIESEYTLISANSQLEQYVADGLRLISN